MRTPLLATVLGLSLAGCLTIGDSGSGSPGDDDTGSGGGGGGGGGSGLGGGSGMGSGAGPNVNVAMDRQTVATELGKTEIVTLNFTSVASFTGSVNVASSLVDGSGAALTTGGLTVTGPASVTLAANGTATAMYTVTIPSNATATQLLANLKLDVSSSLGDKSLSSALTIAPNYTISYPAGVGATVAMHPVLKGTITVKKGAKISVHNGDTTAHRTHADPGNLHEPAGGGQPNGTYVIDTAGLTVGQANVDVGCHTHEQTADYAKVVIE